MNVKYFDLFDDTASLPALGVYIDKKSWHLTFLFVI